MIGTGCSDFGRTGSRAKGGRPSELDLMRTCNKDEETKLVRKNESLKEAGMEMSKKNCTNVDDASRGSSSSADLIRRRRMEIGRVSHPGWTRMSHPSRSRRRT